jgi:hypothetical protein
LLLLQECSEAIEPVVPEAFVAGEPLHGAFHGSGLQAASHRAAALGTLDQVGPRQHVEVLHDRGQRHRERLRQLADGLIVPLRQLLENGAPRRVCQRRKRAIEPFVVNVNHVVKYRDMGRPVKRSKPQMNRTDSFGSERRKRCAGPEFTNVRTSCVATYPHESAP